MKEQEVWKDIINYEGLYKISNQGRIKRFYKNGNTKILAPFLRKNGSKKILIYSLFKNKIQEVLSARKIVATYFVDNPNNYRYSRIKDGDEYNLHYTNIFWSKHYTDKKEKDKEGFPEHLIQESVGSWMDSNQRKYFRFYRNKIMKQLQKEKI